MSLFWCAQCAHLTNAPQCRSCGRGTTHATTRPPLPDARYHCEDPHTLIAVDPGKRYLGVAAFFEGSLVGCTLIRPRGRFSPALVAGALAGWVHSHHRGLPWFLLVETPQHYEGKRAKGSGVRALDATVEALQTYTDSPRRKGVKLVKPMTWKGNVDKVPHHRRVFPVLDTAEQVHWPDDHNVRDAVALGLWGLGRMDAGKTLEGRGPSLDLPDL